MAARWHGRRVSLPRSTSKSGGKLHPDWRVIEQADMIGKSREPMMEVLWSLSQGTRLAPYGLPAGKTKTSTSSCRNGRTNKWKASWGAMHFAISESRWTMQMPSAVANAHQFHPRKRSPASGTGGRLLDSIHGNANRSRADLARVRRSEKYRPRTVPRRIGDCLCSYLEAYRSTKDESFLRDARQVTHDLLARANLEDMGLRWTYAEHGHNRTC